MESQSWRFLQIAFLWQQLQFIILSPHQPRHIPGLCLLSRYSQAVPFYVEYILAVKFSITHQPNSQQPSPRRAVFTWNDF